MRRLRIFTVWIECKCECALRAYDGVKFLFMAVELWSSHTTILEDLEYSTQVAYGYSLWFFVVMLVSFWNLPVISYNPNILYYILYYDDIFIILMKTCCITQYSLCY